MGGENILVTALYYLIAAVIAVIIFKRLGLGSILGYLVAGIVLGPHAIGAVETPADVLHFAEYGVILLLFIIGLELAPEKLWNMRWKIGVIGGSQLLISALIIGLLFMLDSLSWQQAMILGLTLALSSTAFAIQLMGEEHILGSPLGRKGFAILLLQDLAVIPILLLVDVVAQHSDAETAQTAWYMGPLAILGVLALGRYGLNTVLQLVAQTNNREIMTAASLLIVIGTAVLMEAVGLSMGLGAFLAGIMLANSDFRHQLETDIEPFKGILLGLFFIAVGMTLNLPLLFESPLLIIAAALALVTIKTLVIAVILKIRQVAFKDGVKLGLMLSQGGEFAFVVLTQASQLQLFQSELVDQLTLVVGLSMALTAPLVILHRKLWHARSEAMPEYDAHWDDHDPEVIIAGFGRFGQIIGRILQASHIPFTAMDKDATHVAFVKRFGNRIFFGDSTRLDLLIAAGVDDAKILVVAVDNVEQSLAIVELAQHRNPKLTIIARAHNRSHAYELHKRNVSSVIRETFASSLQAATKTLQRLGFTEGQSLEKADMFRVHDEALLLKAVAHKDDSDQLLKLSNQGRLELQTLFEEDGKKPV